MNFTLFKDRYPDLTEAALSEAMSVMDEGYHAQGYYKK